jgi:multicomponent Na+:H+ antiporter subunit B
VSRHKVRGLIAIPVLAGVAALLVWSVVDLPDFGKYRGPYGYVLNRIAVPQRHTTNVVSSIVFDYRGLDTMGEEFILFAAVMGVAMLLREPREEDAPASEDPVRTDALRAFGVSLGGATLVLGLWIVAHGYVTPGGGFQGGVILASAFLLVWLAGSYGAYRRLTPIAAVDFVGGTGAGGYVVVGLVALLLGHAFLHNLLPSGVAGKLSSGGSIPLLNWASALEVSAAFVLLFSEFLSERTATLRR